MNNYSGMFGTSSTIAPPVQRQPGPGSSYLGAPQPGGFGHFDLDTAVAALQKQYPTASLDDLRAMAQSHIQGAQAARDQALQPSTPTSFL